jgi:hypothetical protein
MRSIALRAAIAAVVPALFAALLGSSAPWSWLVAAIALPLGLVTRPRAGAGWTPWLVGVALAAIAAVSAPRARHLLEVASARDWPTVDLALAPVPTSPPEYLAVTGVLRTGIVLDEYDVEDGDVPDQSRPATAVLVPVAPSRDPSVPMRGPLVVARVRPSELAGFADGEATTLRGRAEPLQAELLATITDLAGTGDRPSSGVLVDTLHVPSPRDAWTWVAIAGVLALLAAVAHGGALFAARGP